MICERTTQTNIRDLSKDAESVVYVLGHRVSIDRTPQHLGGTRSWFLCPGCARRCAILYPVRCRKCLGLHYKSEHLSPDSRASLRARRLRQRLGGPTVSLADPIPPKPLWMRWHTYFALRAQIRAADARHLAGMAVFLEGIR
jgi:hypothetical protein